MNPELRKYLERHGLKTEASVFDALKYWQALEPGAVRAGADALAQAAPPGNNAPADPPAGDAPADPPPADPPAGDPPADPPAADPPAQPTQQHGAPPPDPTPAPDAGAAERQRVITIMGVARQTGLDEGWAEAQIKSGATEAQVQAAALAVLTGTATPLPVGANISVGSDLNIDSLGPAIEDAVAMRCNGDALIEMDAMASGGNGTLGPIAVEEGTNEFQMKQFRAKPRKAHPRAREFAGRRISQMARQYLSALGVQAGTMGDMQVSQLVFNRQALGQQLGGYLMVHSTSDFPLLLANVANKTLRRAYVEFPVSWATWARRTTAPDLKSIDRVSFGEASNLPVVKEAGEYKQITFGEKKESYQLAKYGEIFLITLETLINDDLDAFSRLPALLGQAARRTEDVIAYGVITANAVMSDGTALFHADHGNLASGSGNQVAPSTDSLSAGFLAMALQTGQNNDAKLNIQPRFLLSPMAHRQVVLQLLASSADPSGSHAGVANIWQGGLVPVFHPLLDADSSDKWYLAADPGQIDTVEMAFLEGAEQPQVTSEDDSKTDGRRYKVRHWSAAKAIDHRGVYQNPGA